MNTSNYVHMALREDLGNGDRTTDLLVPARSVSEARIIFKEPGVLCGMLLAQAAFRRLDPAARFSALRRDGSRLRKGETLAVIRAKTRALLSAERVALNFLGHLSGIATLTRQFVDAVSGTRAKILDTRKTVPGLRALAKYAVACGGGHNHRTDLSEMVLIKDNHLACMDRRVTIAEALARFKARSRKPVEVEAETFAQFTEAMEAGAQMILLDNMTPAQMRRCVQARDNYRGRKPLLEASGGIRLTNVTAIARTGVDRISIGALTHSAPALDVSMEIIRTWKN